MPSADCISLPEHTKNEASPLSPKPVYACSLSQLSLISTTSVGPTSDCTKRDRETADAIVNTIFAATGPFGDWSVCLPTHAEPCANRLHPQDLHRHWDGRWGSRDCWPRPIDLQKSERGAGLRIYGVSCEECRLRMYGASPVMKRCDTLSGR